MADLDQEQQQALDQLESDVQAMQWEEVSLDPNTTSWEEIEKDLPAEWTTELDLREEYSQEELAELLDRPIDVPEGDIDENAEQALQELDINLDTIAAERDTDLNLDLPAPEHDFDFGR